MDEPNDELDELNDEPNNALDDEKNDEHNENCIEIDECGICKGDNSTCKDCNDVINGTSQYDECGICDGKGCLNQYSESVECGTASNDYCDCEGNILNSELNCVYSMPIGSV